MPLAANGNALSSPELAQLRQDLDVPSVAQAQQAAQAAAAAALDAVPAQVLATPLAGLSLAASAVDDDDSLLVGIGKLQGQLDTKRTELPAVTVVFSDGAPVTAITRATHANRPCNGNTAHPAWLPLPDGAAEDNFEFTNAGTGLITYTGVTAAAGYKTTSGQNELFTAVHKNGGWRSTTPSAAAAVDAGAIVNAVLSELGAITLGAPLSITGDASAQIGATLTVVRAAGWQGPLQWYRRTDSGAAAAVVVGQTGSTLDTSGLIAGDFACWLGAPGGMQYASNWLTLAAAPPPTSGAYTATISDNSSATHPGLKVVMISGTYVEEVDLAFGTEDFFRLTRGGDEAAATRVGIVSVPGLSHMPADVTLATDGAAGTRLRFFRRDDGVETPEIAVQLLKQVFDEVTVTWNASATGNAWQAPGARGSDDRGSEVLAAGVTGATAGYYEVYGAGLTAALQAMRAGTPGHAGLRLSSNTDWNGAVFLNHNGPDGQRPELVLVGTRP